MKRELDLDADVRPYQAVHYHRGPEGYIVWRRGTGGNVELLHLHANEPGGGKRLLAAMLSRLLDCPPYATVFGFTRAGNVRGQQFYLDNGFDLTTVKGVYADGSAVVFSQSFDRLLELHVNLP
jgi:hypothetical protein